VSENELLSLACILFGDKKSPEKKFVDKLRGCVLADIATGSNSTVDENGLTWNLDDIKMVDGWERVKRCKMAFNGLLEFAMSVGGGERVKQASTVKLDEVAFQMIGDDYNNTKSQLDSVRARRPKFICINDDMKEPGKEVIGLLQDFFESFWPERSEFEWRDGVRNKFLNWGEYERVRGVGELGAAVLVWWWWAGVLYCGWLCCCVVGRRTNDNDFGEEEELEEEEEEEEYRIKGIERRSNSARKKRKQKKGGQQEKEDGAMKPSDFFVFRGVGPPPQDPQSKKKIL